MPPPDLTDDDKIILAELLRETIARDRFPLSPRVRSFKAILAKLAPPAPRSFSSRVALNESQWRPMEANEA
jgi:hypothetical protein